MSADKPTKRPTAAENLPSSSPNKYPDPKLDPYEWAEQLTVQRLKEHRFRKEAESKPKSP